MYKYTLAIMFNVFMMHSANANSFFEQFNDPLDGEFDTSDWLQSNSGFLPVPIIITEPAVGTGFGLATIFFHDSSSQSEPSDVDKTVKEKAPPSLSVLFGAKSENETWFVGGAHRGIWYDDSIRYTGALVC